MNYKALGLLGLASLTGVLAGCYEPVPFSTDREIVVNGKTSTGNQFRVVVDVDYDGEVPDAAFGAQWVDDRALNPSGMRSIEAQEAGYPVLNSILANRLQNVSGNLEDGTLEASILRDVQEGIEQFNQQTLTNRTNVFRLEASLGEDAIVSLIDLYATADANFQNFLDGNGEYYDQASGNVSATDSDGDGNLSASAVDILATQRYGRVINAHFICPGIAVGTCKKDVPKSQAELPTDVYTNVDGLQGGGTVPIVPVAPPQQ